MHRGESVSPETVQKRTCTDISLPCSRGFLGFSAYPTAACIQIGVGWGGGACWVRLLLVLEGEGVRY